MRPVRTYDHVSPEWRDSPEGQAARRRQVMQELQAAIAQPIVRQGPRPAVRPPPRPSEAPTAGALVTYAEAAALAEVHLYQVGDWVYRGKLRNVGGTARGKSLVERDRVLELGEAVLRRRLARCSADATLTYLEAAALLGESYDTVRYLLRVGRLGNVGDRHGGRVLARRLLEEKLRRVRKRNREIRWEQDYRLRKSGDRSYRMSPAARARHNAGARESMRRLRARRKTGAD